MADSPPSSDLSDPPSVESDNEDRLSTTVPSSRPSVDITNTDIEHLAPPPKRRKTGPSSLVTFDRAPSSQPDQDDDNISLSSDGYSSAPGSPNDDEYALREQAQTQCLWRDCEFGAAVNNDELVRHVQSTHCATGGPKKTKYICEWGECQRKASNHPSGYALKAHMRSHTKEKPYYCALPECDKAFTRSDALAKHMRTVHEPEPVKGAAGQNNEPTSSGKKGGLKIKLANGSGSTKVEKTPADMGPTHDEDGNEVEPSPQNDNIQYMPAHHPITGQPGFMIHYPPDIHFTAWESSIAADQLMRLLRRQLHWATKESDDLKKEIADLERQKREEWTLKEILLEGAMEAELATADQKNLLAAVDERVHDAMIQDTRPSKEMQWTRGEPDWRRPRIAPYRDEDVDMSTPERAVARHSPSPPPTGVSGGFDGEADPYDNYLAGRMAEYEERERLRSMQNTPAKAAQQAAEADAVGALMGLSNQT